MRTILTLILAASLTAALAQPTLDEIRNELVFEDFDKEQILHFYTKMSGLQNPEPVVLAYKGVSEALMAKVRWDPFRKLSHLSEARKMIDDAISKDDKNLEIRFLRFSLEYHVPAILRINENLEEDKLVILSNLRLLDNFHFEDDMVQYILEFLDETQLCTAEEVGFIQSKFSRT